MQLYESYGDIKLIVASIVRYKEAVGVGVRRQSYILNEINT